jgi:hypothetical protein
MSLSPGTDGIDCWLSAARLLRVLSFSGLTHRLVFCIQVGRCQGDGAEKPYPRRGGSMEAVANSAQRCPASMNCETFNETAGCEVCGKQNDGPKRPSSQQESAFSLLAQNRCPHVGDSVRISGLAGCVAQAGQTEFVFVSMPKRPESKGMAWSCDHRPGCPVALQ